MISMQLCKSSYPIFPSFGLLSGGPPVGKVDMSFVSTSSATHTRISRPLPRICTISLSGCACPSHKSRNWRSCRRSPSETQFRRSPARVRQQRIVPAPCPNACTAADSPALSAALCSIPPPTSTALPPKRSFGTRLLAVFERYMRNFVSSVSHRSEGFFFQA